jgi:Ca2+-binding RTX toxin-like protein
MGRRREIRATLLLAAALLTWAAAPAQAKRPLCAGERATITGTRGSDFLKATGRHDVIVAGSGADTVVGRGRGDLICGGRGPDLLRGGVSEDRLVGGPGADEVRAGRGDDRLYGGSGNDVLQGDKADDIVRGGPGNDDIDAGLGDDRAYGGRGGDRIAGNWGYDWLWGEEGAGDVVSGGGGRDRMSGGAGARDIVSFASDSPGAEGVWVALGDDRAGTFDGRQLPEVTRHFEDVIGTTAPDRLAGDSGPNRIDGGGGNDLLSGQPFGCWCPAEAPDPADLGDIAFGGSSIDSCIHFESAANCEETSAGQFPLPLPLPPPADPPGAVTAIELNEGLDGPTLNISGPPEPHAPGQDVSVWYASGDYLVEDPGGVGVRSGCIHESPIRARCASRFLGHGITAQLGGGDDTLRVLGGIRLVASGGPGRDKIYSGNGDDVIQGSLGRDVIEAGGGDDVLTARKDPDRLRGQGGNDLLIAFTICERHVFNGGYGVDTASFIRLKRPVVARAGRRARSRDRRRCLGVYLRKDEAIEGSRYGDILIGNGEPNSLLGRQGPDIFRGRGGKDNIDARDKHRDAIIDCGRGPDRLRRDGSDPRGRSC